MYEKKKENVLVWISYGKGIESTVSKIYLLAASSRGLRYVQTGRLRRCRSDPQSEDVSEKDAMVYMCIKAAFGARKEGC